MVSCPRCGTDIPMPTKEWDYSAFHVKRYYCKKCDSGFLVYYREGKLSHTIPTIHARACKLVYELLKELGGKAFPTQIKELALEKYPNRKLHTYVYNRLYRLQKEGYVCKNPDGTWSIIAEYPSRTS